LAAPQLSSLTRRRNSHHLTGNTPAAAQQVSLQRPEFSDILEVHKRPFSGSPNLNYADNVQWL
jgi:hypothetical protein